MAAPDWPPTRFMQEYFNSSFPQEGDTEIKLTLDFIPWDNFYTNVAASLTSGEQKYSMIVSDSQWLGAFIEGGYFQNLNKYIDADPELQAIFDEIWTLDGQEVVSDIWDQYNTWKSAQWLDSDILEVANFGGDFFQLVNQGFNQVADTIKLADFTSGTSTNTFLNLVSQVVDDVSFNYDATNNLLTLNLDPAKVTVNDSYTVNEYVWVGKLEESVTDQNVLDISTYKFWQVNSLNTSTNSVILYIPPVDATIISPTGEAPTGDLTVLLSSTSMVDLMY